MYFSTKTPSEAAYTYSLRSLTGAPPSDLDQKALPTDSLPSTISLLTMGDCFKWFGEGFEGFPKRLPDDCVEYSMYILDTRLKDIEVRDRLRQVQNAVSSLTKPLLKDFIWQREAFGVRLEFEASRSLLRGRTNYGDSIDDEWLIVYILRELSQKFPDIWIRVVDADGQFLLIEAASALPIWLNPEIADFRVWINNGKLLIIPLEKPGGARRGIERDADNIMLEEAIAWIINPKKKLQHSSKVEAEAFFRLQKYPQGIADSLHYALVRIPRKLAYVLHSNAGYVSPAVEAFYLRDPIALKPLQAKETSNLIFPPDDLVRISIRFTKVGYAQIKSQQFTAPPAWVNVSENEANAKWQNQAEIGLKLACGFEMLVSDPQKQDNKVVREITMLLEDLQIREAQLPSNDDIGEWGLRDDDDSWLDINYEEFEKELASNGNGRPTSEAANFGDRGAQNNLRKIVERFQDILKDDDAGLEGAEHFDDVEYDHEGDDSSDNVSTVSDESNITSSNIDADSHEDEFTGMIRGMMGMPTHVMKEMMCNTRASLGRQAHDIGTAVKRSDKDLKRSSEDEDEEDIRQAMQRTEQELRDAGVLEFESHVDPNENL
ncbi:MAG: hypothetical protein Q9217_003286 [Psora testacea]